MPRQTAIEGLIPDIYKRNALHNAIFFWINGQRAAFPNGISIEISLQEFYKFINITEDDLPIKTAKQVYTRMYKELIEKIKSDG
jgi:hypothetical protein